MKTRTGSYRILWFQGGGFALILIITLLSDIIFHDRYEVPGINWTEIAVECLIVVGVALPVLFVVRRILSRLHYLEGFLRVCAWCRKVENRDEWIPIEELFLEEFHLESSHGICPACYASAQAKRREKTSLGTSGTN